MTQTDVTTYLKTLSPAQRNEYARIKRIVKKLVPGVQEKRSYGILALTLSGKFLIYFGGFKSHMSVYPPTHKYTEDDLISEAEIIRRVKKRLKELV